MRIRCVIGLVLVLLAATASADRGGSGNGRGSKWKQGPDWAQRAPRVIERATRDALRRIEPWLPPAPVRQAAPPAQGREPLEPSREPVQEPRAIEPLREAEPAREPEPAVTIAKDPVASLPQPSRESRLSPRGVAPSGLVLLLALLALAGRRARRIVPVHVTQPRLVAALPVAVSAAREEGRTTRPRAAIEAAVEEAVAAEPAPFPGGGRYEILEQIGRGGMGVVYKARDKRLDRVVALKRLPDTLESEPRYVELLLREARSAARLNHRNIVTVHDVDREDGAWFITMEFLEGSSVEALLRERGRIAPRSVVWLAEHAVAGLGYAHARGIVHRDVKPANLFVTSERGVKLMDFGVAKILEEARRKRTLIGGTPAYMAPEQAIGEQVDGRADLYALGAMLFELLTGEVPFATGDPLYHHRATEPDDPRKRASGIPDALAELVLALLRKRPDQRPAGAAEVAVRLRAIAAQLPAVRAAAARCVLWMALGLASIAAPVVHAASGEERNAIVVAANDSQQDDAKGWRRVPGWMKRNLDPRRLGRATRDALRRDEPEQPKQRAAARKPATKPRAAPAAPLKTPDPQSVSPPAAIVSPVPAAPAPTSPTPRARAPSAARVESTARMLFAISFTLGVLAAAWKRSRAGRRAAAPSPLAAPLVALPRAVAETDHTQITRPNATIDVAVETAIESADTEPSAFPIGGRYEILEQLGRGAMGVVYKARDKRLDRIVALKRLPDELAGDTHAVSLLLGEARSAARLNHRNIVIVHDVDREDGSWFITMELLEGELLSSALRAQGRLAPARVAALGEQVALGLDYAHEHGIVHRDVKPANLFVTRDGTVKLLDFGVAKILDGMRRRHTQIGGTPSYMAPEQVLGEGIDGRTDLYALGATLFELLTGQVPFPKGDPAYHHRESAPPDPRERVGGIPDAFAELVLALLRKQPDERPASAQAVAARLREIAASAKS